MSTETERKIIKHDIVKNKWLKIDYVNEKILTIDGITYLHPELEKEFIEFRLNKSNGSVQK